LNFMKRIHALAVVLAVLSLFPGCATTQATRLVSREERNFREVSIGLCEDYPKESRSLAAARNDLALLKTNGIHVMRISFSWLDMEPEFGKFDWSFWDDFVRVAVDEYQIRLIPYICYTPRWASSSTNQDFWQHPPKDDAAFANFLRQLVDRYKNRIHSWEIWNEPDNPYYWRGSVEQFETLLQVGATAVRQSDPQANIVMGGLAWNPEFLESIISNPAAFTNVDVVNLHNYYETWASEPLERIPDYIGRAADLLQHHNFRKPIWMAEVGYSDFRRGDFVSGQYFAHFENEHTAATQAGSLFRALTLALASGNVDLIAWYRIHDLPGTQDVIGDENNRHLGVLDMQNRAKPALGALHFFNSLFSEGFRCLDDKVRVEKIIGAPVETHVFQKPDGSFVAAAWLKTYVPGQSASANSAAIAADQRAATIKLEFPFALKSAHVFDETGGAQGIASVNHRGSGSQIFLKLKDESVTVLRVR
jgi:hypothetical protein